LDGRRRDGGPRGLPGWIRSSALSVSADGSFIVGESILFPAGEVRAVRWDPDGEVIDFGAGTAWDVSADGSVVVGVDGTGLEAFRWTEEDGMAGLGSFGPRRDSWAFGVSADGSIVVGRSNHVAFIWDAIHGMRSVEEVLVSRGLGSALAGWHLTTAYDVSADGLTIVGVGGNPSGGLEAWIAFLPEPTVLPLLGAALATLLLARRLA
jgi:uncharacterized membrane protein